MTEATGPRRIRCGYPLRGLTSKRCPECGLDHDFVELVLYDQRDFVRARAVLDDADLLVLATNPNQLVSVIAGGNVGGGHIWVSSEHVDRSLALLKKAGLTPALRQVPVVDRAEPRCPACQAELSPHRGCVCPDCGEAFQWIDVGTDADAAYDDRASSNGDSAR